MAQAFPIIKRDDKGITYYVDYLQEDNVQMVNYLLMNANKHLNEELADQQSKMKDAIFYNSTMVLENQLKY